MIASRNNYGKMAETGAACAPNDELPNPNSSPALVPQHSTLLALSKAHEPLTPAATELAPATPETVVADSTCAETPPVPTCPKALLPQHWTVPPLKRVQ
jgi:hypothetical protein